MDIEENGKEPLVSIITACYNEEKYISELLDSVLNQTYGSIEMICVDDGSTDDTERIIISYINKFENRNYKLKYIYQDNAGQAAATNKALKYINGEYLCWIDGDDYITENSVEKRVRYLEQHKDVGIVASDFYLSYHNQNKLETKSAMYGQLNYQSNQFNLALMGESIIENLAQMIRVEDFKKINPSMEIVDCREGQNYQILLPMLYHYKRGYLDEKLGYYRIHDDSHCHKKRTYIEQVKRFDDLIEMERNILFVLGISEFLVESYIKESTFYIEKRRYLEYAGN